MAEDPSARPLSGEIMTGSAAPTRGRGVADDVVDAVVLPVSQSASPASAPAIDTPAPRERIGTAAPPLQGLGVLKAGDITPPANMRGGPVFWIIGLALAVGAFWISGGHALVSDHTPAATVPVGAPKFRIGEVTSYVETSNGRLVLYVEGEALNDGTVAGAMPALEIVVTATNGETTRYKLGTGSQELAPGARFDFSSRLEAPKNGVKSVMVDFMREEK